MYSPTITGAHPTLSERHGFSRHAHVCTPSHQLVPDHRHGCAHIDRFCAPAVHGLSSLSISLSLSLSLALSLSLSIALSLSLSLCKKRGLSLWKSLMGVYVCACACVVCVVAVPSPGPVCCDWHDKYIAAIDGRRRHTHTRPSDGMTLTDTAGR